jgi:DDE superfamily endonuclease
MSETSSDSSNGDALILTGDEMLLYGLKLLGWEEKQLVRKSKNNRDNLLSLFKSDFGASPAVVAQIFEDLQTTDLPAARISFATMDDAAQLLYALNFLKQYPTEGQRQNKWHLCDKNLRENGWDLLLRLQALKAEKIVWPTDEEIGNNIWIGTVDGTHIKSQEPNHPTLPKDTKAFSYKNKAAGFSYEIVVSLWKSNIIWINGPFKASVHDNTIFSSPGGLKEKLTAAGLKVIGDSGYGGMDDVVSRLHSIDSPEVSKFKVRARMRQEAVNAKIKTLRCADSACFRHMGNYKDGQPKFKICFEAAVVVTQYKMDISEPLFDI